MGCSGSTSAAAPPMRADDCFHSKYVLTSPVDHGSFVQVKLARKGKDVADRAARILDLAAPTASESKGRLMQAQHEEEIWRMVGRHPNVLELLEVHYGAKDAKEVRFVTELCAGTLGEERHASLVQDEQQFAKVAIGMLEGVSYLHDVEVLHRNLKPSNFWLSNETVKVCDFSMAVLMPRSGKVRGFAGTAPLMAPEMVKEQSYGFGVDAWSLGATCYLLLLGRLPYEPAQGVLGTGEAFRNAIKQGVSPSFESIHGRALSKNALDFLQSLLARDPEERATVSTALTCAYLNTDCAERGAQGAADSLMAVFEDLDASAMDRMRELPSLKYADRDEWTSADAKTWTYDSLPSMGKPAGQLPTVDSLPSMADSDSEEEEAPSESEG